MALKYIVFPLLLVASTAPALSQSTSDPSKMIHPIQEAMETAYALGIQTGQRFSEAMRNDEERLKWVLDNWVPKQLEPAKP